MYVDLQLSIILHVNGINFILWIGFFIQVCVPHVILTPVLFFLRVDFHCLKIFVCVCSLSEVQLLRVHVTFHTLPLFMHLKVTQQWKSTLSLCMLEGNLLSKKESEF